MIFLQAIFLLLFVLVFIPVCLFALQVAIASLDGSEKSRQQNRTPSFRPSIAVLVPAHNEASGLAATLNAITEQLQTGDCVVVVADNCTDGTAGVAIAAGAEVIERNDEQHRGKGYALDYGIRYLEATPPEVVIIVDADCLVHDNALSLLARQCAAVSRPIQALYLMHAPLKAGLKARMAAFAWAVKNWARPLGYHRLGLPCQLMGTGMAFPWRLIQKAELASGHIVEDLKLGLDFAAAGYAPQFCPDALVTSVFPMNTEGVQSQRTRWEHGHLGMIFKEGPHQLVKSLTTMNGPLLSLVIDMCVPPLALLTLLVLVLCLFGGVLLIVTGEVLPWGLAIINLFLLGVAVLLAWARFGRGILSLSHLAYAPLYALAKVPLYLKFLVQRQVEWVRSRRDDS
jgi:cellulose synthase/poly-beta-1,6-N-acetylglucosamine synthase-like glycosyltransferase